MTIDEAIKHAEEVAEEHECDLKVYENLGKDRELFKKEENNCKKCGEQHRQLAEWLKELKILREQTRWIPVSERLPEENKDVLIDIKEGKKHSFYVTHLVDATYWVRLGRDVNVVAWQPLPKPYKAEMESEER